VQDPYAKRFMKDEKITKTAYIANSGGLLGLCMGFSLGESQSWIEQDLQNNLAVSIIDFHTVHYAINVFSSATVCHLDYTVLFFITVSAAEILYHCLFGLFSPLCNKKKVPR
jgi:hypothetical protein